MLLATDVGYGGLHEGSAPEAGDPASDGSSSTARAAGVLFADWSAAEPTDTIVESIDDVDPYVPGEFYRRELPCLWPVVMQARARGPLDIVIVDGFVDLGPDRPGLGRHLHERLKAEGIDVAVVGVAKNPFRGADAAAVLRGDSVLPLWVTAAGFDVQAAAAAVRSMHGPYRFPTLLRRVDQLANGVI